MRRIGELSVLKMSLRALKGRGNLLLGIATSLALLAMTNPSYSAVSIETSVSRSVLAVGEDLVLDIIISDSTGKIIPPNITTIDGFSSYSQGRSQEISIINGISSSRNIFSYVLVANSVGKKKIGPFSITIGGKPYQVSAVDVEVMPDKGSSQNVGYAQAVFPSIPSQQPVNSPPQRALPTEDIGGQDIFVKVWFDKDEVFVNEPATLTYTLYTRMSATYKGFEKEPVTTGFWVEDFPPEKVIHKTEKILNGSRYVVADVRKMALFPTKAGVFTIDPGILAASVEVRNADDFNNFFSSNVFGRRSSMLPPAYFSQIVPKTIPTESQKLTVKALPETGKPQNFSGAVGKYAIESSVDKKEVEEGTPITYKIRIFGRGNINTVQTPNFPVVDDFKAYDSSSSVNISKDDFVVQGEKVTETVIVPKKAGTYTIPALSFSYFDPEDAQYKEIKTAVQTIQVKPSTLQEPSVQDSGGSGVVAVQKEGLKNLAKDIRFIKQSKDMPLSWTQGFLKNPFYWPFNIFLLIAALTFAILAEIKSRVGSDLKGLRLRRSHRVARQKLKKANQFLKKNDQEAFFSELSRALHGYFADKLNLSEQAVNAEAIEKGLTEPAPALINEAKSLFHELALGRFARSNKTHEEMQELYSRADRLIVGFEKVKVK